MASPSNTAGPNEEIALISSLSVLAELRAQWTALEGNCHSQPSVFQSFDWVHEWAKLFANEAGSDHYKIQILTGYRKGRLVFVMPLMLRHTQSVKMLTWLSDPFAQYGDILCDRSEDAATWMESALHFYESNFSADILHLRHVRSDANLAQFAQQRLKDAHLNEWAPFLDLTGFKSPEDYDKRYSPTQKRRRKKIRNHLTQLGPLSFTAVREPALRDEAIQSAVAEKEIWLKTRGRVSRVTSCPKAAEFLRRLAELPDNSIKTVVTKMMVGDKPASWDISFRYKGTNYCYITSHVNELNDLSPARLHMDLSQRLSLADGMKTFDLMVPNDLHKDSWCSGRVAVNDYYYAFSAKGRLFGAAYLGWLRPLMRKTYYRLPKSVLVAIKPFLG
jgi:CelD/BcsL family acetyltransferase involved in cellulose biosynthesis